MRKFSFTIAAATLFAASIAQGAEPVSLTVGYQPTTRSHTLRW